MPCSEAQLAANRANAARSTGPKTVEGKERSRRNSLRHGLSGAGIVLPHEDEAAVAARFAEFEADLQPRGGVERFFVRRAALLSIRLDRAALHEAARLTATILGLEEAATGPDEDGEAIDVEGGVKALFAALLARPATARAEVLAEADGADRLLVALSVIRRKLHESEGAGWTAGHGRLLEALLGHDPAARPARSRLLGDVVLGDCSQLKAAETADLDVAGKRRWAAARLAQIIDGEIEQLRGWKLAHPAAPPSARADAGLAPAHRALVDAEPAAVLARRYEASAERGLFRTMAEIRRLKSERETSDRVAPFDPGQPAAAMGSSGREARPTIAAGVAAPFEPAWLDPGLARGPVASVRRAEDLLIGRPPTKPGG